MIYICEGTSMWYLSIFTKLITFGNNGSDYDHGILYYFD